MKKIYGILYALMASIAFGLMPILVKVAYRGGAKPVTVVFLRFFLAAIILLAYFLICHIDFKIGIKPLLKITLLGIIGYSSTCLTLFLSYKYVSLGLATAIHFVYPSLVVFLSFIIYKEELNLSKIIALILSLIGIFVLIGPGETRLSFTGVILAFASGIFYALCVLELGKGATKEVDSIVLTFYLCMSSALGILVYGLGTKSLNFGMDLFSFAAVGGVALICTVFAIFAFSVAIKIIGSSNTAIINTLEPVTSIILGILIFGEELSMGMIVGSMLIILSAVIFCLTPKKSKKAQSNKVGIATGKID